MIPYLGHGCSNLLYSFLIVPSQTINQDWYYDLSLAPAGFWAHVRNDGGDIRVFKRDGITQLPREVSGFDFAGQQGALYIGGAVGETAFYVCYGNPAFVEPPAGSTYGKYAVWEPTASLVQHLEDLTNSTATAHPDTSLLPPPIAAAKIRNGASFDGTGNYLYTADAPDLRPANLTLCTWFNPNGAQPIDGLFRRLVQKNYEDAVVIPYISYGFLFTAAGNTIVAMHSSFTGNPALSTAAVAFVANAWNFVTATFDGATLRIFLAGAPAALAGGLGAIAYSTGGFMAARSYPGQPGRYNGLLDEVRLYSRVLSNPEIAAMHANQNAPAAFWATGIETRAACQYAL